MTNEQPTDRATLAMGPLRAPNGKEIVGTKELIPGVANISPPVRDHNGKVQFDYLGGTDIFWDDQETVERDDQIVFIDEDGEEWLESQLELVKED